MTMEVNLTAPSTSIIQSTALLNWTRILSNDRNITEHHISINKYQDGDVTTLVIVCMGIAIMIAMMIFHKYLEEGRLVRCCNLRRENEDVVNAQDSVSGVAGMAAVFARLKKKETPPPPYEDPPSYDVAVQMEIELTKSDLKVTLPNVLA